MKKSFLILLTLSPFLFNCAPEFKSEVLIKFCDNRPSKTVTTYTLLSSLSIDNYDRALPEFSYYTLDPKRPRYFIFVKDMNVCEFNILSQEAL